MMKVTEITGFGPPKVYYSDDTAKDYFPLESRPAGLQHMLIVNMDVQTRRIANKKADKTITSSSDDNLVPIDPEDSSDEEVALSSDGSSSDDLDPTDQGVLDGPSDDNLDLTDHGVLDESSDNHPVSIDHSTLEANAQPDFEIYSGLIIQDEDEDRMGRFKEPEHAIIREQLREIVSRDALETPRIDMVRLVGLDIYELPSRLTWNTLDGLRPRHLELICGYCERCKIGPLDSMKTQWPLESMSISSAAAVTLNSLVMNRISSLTFNFCCNMIIPPAFGAGGSLRRLIILENDALDMFVHMSKDGVLDSLEELKVASTNGCDGNSTYPQEFLEAMSHCSTLHSLDLAMSVPSEYQKLSDFVRLPHHLPHNLEHFRFWGQPEMAENVDSWLECALDPNWLPSLKTWSFNLDVAKNVNLLEAHEAQKLAQKLTDFMLNNRPNLVLASPEPKLVPIPGMFCPHCASVCPRPVKLIKDFRARIR